VTFLHILRDGHKFLLENGLRPTEEHTVIRSGTASRSAYRAEAQDSLIDSLMGHDTYKPKYGKGPSLELKLKYFSELL